MAEPSTIYKIIILYMLDQLKAALSNTQIADFFLEKDYTNYFNVQTILNDLLDSDLLFAESTHGNTQYHLTDTGRDTLRYHEEKLTPDIKNDIDHYFAAHALSIRQENSLLADYYRTTDQDYAVRLQYKEKGRQRIDLTLTVPNKEVAEAACRNWRTTNDDLYAYLLDLLIR